MNVHDGGSSVLDVFSGILDVHDPVVHQTQNSEIQFRILNILFAENVSKVEDSCNIVAVQVPAIVIRHIRPGCMLPEQNQFSLTFLDLENVSRRDIYQP